MGLFRRRKPPAPRSEMRLPTLNSVDVVSPNGELISQAALRDISSSGARLRIDDVKAVPNTIRMRLPLLGIETTAMVKWRSDTEIGLEFEAPIDLTPIVGRKKSRAETVALHFTRGR